MSTGLLVGWVELDRALGPSLGCTKQTALVDFPDERRVLECFHSPWRLKIFGQPSLGTLHTLVHLGLQQ